MSQTNKAKIRVVIKDDILKIKFMIDSLMIGEAEAEKKEIAPDYITDMVLRVGERILFDFKSSGNMALNPLIKLKVKQKELKEGDLMELEWTTTTGYKGHYSKKIKNYVKP
ncbi:MAG: thiosulfate oxidation carrier complex protein SoxZ [Sulfurovum sp.]|nr:thiosulfate oxidation carrier complex protein SoxZ [Sulfurovum sp.]